MGLTRVLFRILGRGFTGRDLILGAGGLFLLGKATHEIHEKLERGPGAPPAPAGASSFAAVLAQIAMHVNRVLRWDPEKEVFTGAGADAVNGMLARNQRAPYGTDAVLAKAGIRI